MQVVEIPGPVENQPELPWFSRCYPLSFCELLPGNELSARQ
jgi:hypothetical protein